MKALVKYALGEGNMEIRDVPEPTPGPEQVKIEVKAAGICGSDLHIYHNDIKLALRPPVIVGHEFAGVIVETGNAVSDFRIGERVTSETSASVCGHCLACRAGYYNVCAEKKLTGYVFDGCFAKYCVVDAKRLHRLPESVDFLSAALTEPLACCVHAVLELTTVSAGDVVAITGPGPIGLLCLQLAKAAGAYTILCGTNQDVERLQFARKLGADLAVNVQAEDALEAVKSRTDGEGADVVFECSGAPAGARLGLTLVRRRGQYTQVGLFGRPFELDFELIAYRELRVTGSLGQRYTAWKRSLALLERGQVNTKALVSHQFSLSQWREAFQAFEEKKGLKIVLLPEG